MTGPIPAANNKRKLVLSSTTFKGSNFHSIRGLFTKWDNRISKIVQLVHNGHQYEFNDSEIVNPQNCKLKITHP